MSKTLRFHKKRNKKNKGDIDTTVLSEESSKRVSLVYTLVQFNNSSNFYSIFYKLTFTISKFDVYMYTCIFDFLMLNCNIFLLSHPVSQGASGISDRTCASGHGTLSKDLLSNFSRSSCNATGRGHKSHNLILLPRLAS